LSAKNLPLISFDNPATLGMAAWLAMFFSILIWSQSNLRAGELGDSTNYYRIVLVLFAAAGSIVTLVTNYQRLRDVFSGPLMLLLIYALVALLSSAYVPEHAFYSMWKSAEILVDILVIAAIMSYDFPQNSARSAYLMLPILYGALVIVYLVEAAMMPSLAFQVSRGYLSLYMSGVLPVMAQNALAFLSAVCAFALICRLSRPGNIAIKSASLVMLGLALTTLILAQSRTSIVALALAVMVYFLFDRRFKLLLALAVGSAVVGVYTSSFDVSYQYLLRGQDAHLVTTLSGRTEGWEKAWLAFQEAPITGHGFAAFARVNILGTTGMSSMHGAIFDVLVGTGLMGFIPWAGAILWTFVRLFALTFSRHPWFESEAGRGIQAEMMGVAVLILVRASTSSGLALHQDNFMLFLTVLAYVTTMRRAVAADARDEISALRPDRSQIPSLSKA
jgi:O-antigen ligase